MSPMLYKPHIVTVKKCTTQAPTKGWHHINQHMYHKYHDGYAVIVNLYLCNLFIHTYCTTFYNSRAFDMCRLVIPLIYLSQSCLTTKEWSVDLLYPAFCNLNLSTTVLVIFVNMLWSGHTLLFSNKDLPTCT